MPTSWGFLRLLASILLALLATLWPCSKATRTTQPLALSVSGDTEARHGGYLSYPLLTLVSLSSPDTECLTCGHGPGAVCTPAPTWALGCRGRPWK